MGIGAHPDDVDFLIGGLSIKLSELGHKVKFVSATNGNMGHHEMMPGPLMERRMKEANAAAKALGAEFECLGIDDANVYVNKENTDKVVKVIREFDPQLVITHRPSDYHRDHRYTGQLVVDASYILILPLYMPEFPPRTRDMPVIVFGHDRFTTPRPFRPDIILDITSIFEDKVSGLSKHESQIFEWIPWTFKMDEIVERAKGDKSAREELVKTFLDFRFARIMDRYRALFKDLLPERKVTNCEMFEICEYGRQPTKTELKKFFPGAIFPSKKKLKSLI